MSTVWVRIPFVVLENFMNIKDIESLWYDGLYTDSEVIGLLAKFTIEEAYSALRIPLDIQTKADDLRNHIAKGGKTIIIGSFC